jgi:hypothetical protein
LEASRTSLYTWTTAAIVTNATRVSLGNGTSVLIETEAREEEGVANVLPSFSDLVPTIVAVASQLRAALENAAPTKASVEFGLELAVDSGKLTALIVKGTAKANLKITLSWERK